MAVQPATTADLPDPLQALDDDTAANADALLRQLAGDEVDRLLVESYDSTTPDAALDRPTDTQHDPRFAQGESPGTPSDPSFSAKPIDRPSEPPAVAAVSNAPGLADVDALSPEPVIADAMMIVKTPSQHELSGQMATRLELPEETTAGHAPSDQKPVEQPPNDQAATEQTPIDQAPSEQGSLKKTPVEQSPVEPNASAPEPSGQPSTERSSPGHELSEQDSSVPTASAPEASAPHPPAPDPSIDAELDTATTSRGDEAPPADTQLASELADAIAEQEQREILGLDRTPLLLRPLIWVNRPFAGLSEPTRELLGTVGLVTMVNALVMLLYVMLVRG